MQDPAAFFKQRALAAFHRRKTHALGSEERKHDCDEARSFLKNYRAILHEEPSGNSPMPGGTDAPQTLTLVVSNPLPPFKLAWLEEQRKRVAEEFDKH